MGQMIKMMESRKQKGANDSVERKIETKRPQRFETGKKGYFFLLEKRKEKREKETSTFRDRRLRALVVQVDQRLLLRQVCNA